MRSYMALRDYICRVHTESPAYLFSFHNQLQNEQVHYWQVYQIRGSALWGATQETP